jgi:assimilatory nitrate reductase catalytic subunit
MSEPLCIGGWVDVGAIDDIPRLGSRVVKTAKGDIAVFRNAADEIFALEDRCPHKGGPLSQGIVHGRSVTCPLHNWNIDLESGEAAAPDRGCAPKIPIKIEDDRIFLRVGPQHDAHTTCPYCGVGCGVIASPKGEITGDQEHPANRGRLCSKGAALGETLDDADRLLTPRIDGRDADWDTALSLVADRFEQTVREHGPESVAFYVSGQLLTEDYYVANKLMKGFIGGANIDTNSRLCMASTVSGHVRAFGADVVPGIYEDLDEADLIVVVGSNTAWCHPVLFQRMIAAKMARGARIVTIDPRGTATSAEADLHLQLAPGSDVALFDGLLTYLAENGHIDAAFVDRHTAGIEATLEAAGRSAGTITQAAAIAELPTKDIETFFAWFAATERTVTIFSQGVNQSSAGTDKVNAIINCHLATGRIGRPGMGPFSLTGQPNAMGGREVGGLATQLAAHMGFEPDDIDRVRRFWHAPAMASRPGLKAVDMFDAVLDGRIKAILIMATNPAASMPRAQRVRDALQVCPFVVVSDCWDTDTTALAHVVLPAAGWGEKDGTVTNSDRLISRQRAFRAAPGQARPDWWVLAGIGQRMGWPDAFAYQRPADIFREHAALSAFENHGGRAFNIGALATLTDPEYEAMAPARWPMPVSGIRSERMFGDGQFFTEDRRARLTPTPWRPPAMAASDAYPLMLNTGRMRDQWHTMTRTGRIARLMTHADEPILAVSDRDATALGLADGGLVRVETAFGASVLKVCPSAAQRPGEIFVPMHWTDRFASAGPIARLVSGATDPISGQPELKATPARLTVIATQWRGLLVRRKSCLPTGAFYAARIPVEGAQTFELAGFEALPEGEDLNAFIDGLLDSRDVANRVTAVDVGSYRFAQMADGRLSACLFLELAPTALPDRAVIAALMDKNADHVRRSHIFGGAVGQANPSGRIICSCFTVGLKTIRGAIADRQAATVDEIGAVLKAGTNCGSCIPELKEILRHAHAA